MAAKPEYERRGISASPGIVIGPAFVRDAERLNVPRKLVDASAVEAEVARFLQALADTARELRAIKSDIARRMGDDHARIFDAHLLILEDRMLIDDTSAAVRNECNNAAAAFEKVINRVIASIAGIEDEYLKERTMDVQDVKKRVLRMLIGKDTRAVNRPTELSVVVARDLSPSDTAQLERGTVLAMRDRSGRRTSHTAIISARRTPGGGGVESGGQGRNRRYRHRRRQRGQCGHQSHPGHHRAVRKRDDRRELETALDTHRPATTLDGRSFTLSANLDSSDEVGSVIDHGGQGVGLFRTEYFFISQEYLPSEEDQYKVYRQVAERMDGRPVVIRTLDVGGDKIASYLNRSPELNPFMGWRGIRFCLTRKDIFKTQLRAIYRASAHGKVKIMFPMISMIEEVLRTKEICAEVRADLKRERYKFDANAPLGIMVETPAAVAMADQFAREVEFFSIGTNDLIQYTMAVDRGNSKIAHLYQHLQPSILRLLRLTVEAARKRKIPVSVCGEMAGDPLSVPILIGLGIDEFSSCNASEVNASFVR
jgi:phosphotransferase system enzyme I (PtsI)